MGIAGTVLTAAAAAAALLVLIVVGFAYAKVRFKIATPDEALIDADAALGGGVLRGHREALGRERQPHDLLEDRLDEGAAADDDALPGQIGALLARLRVDHGCAALAAGDSPRWPQPYADALGSIDGITVIDKDGASRVTGQVASGVHELTALLKAQTGIDVLELVRARAAAGSSDAGQAH